jgi:hypothetical protein
MSRLLLGLPFVTGLGARSSASQGLSAPDDHHGSSYRRQRRKARHYHDLGNDKDQRTKGKDQTPPAGSAPQPGCVPASKALTCAGQCAQVAKTCGTIGNGYGTGTISCGGSCSSGQVCRSNQSVNWGDVRQPCCAGNTCTGSNTICSNGRCLPAGPSMLCRRPVCHRDASRRSMSILTWCRQEA